MEGSIEIPQPPIRVTFEFGPDVPNQCPFLGQSGRHLLMLSVSQFDPGCVKTASLLSTSTVTDLRVFLAPKLLSVHGVLIGSPEGPFLLRTRVSVSSGIEPPHI
jgi:hypothetical protein